MSASLSQLIQEYFYLLGALIGALCVFEANILLKTKTSWFRDKRLLWSTTIEFAWLIIVCLGLFSWDLTGWKALSCLAFLVNYLVACIYTWYLFRGVNIESLDDFKLPRWYLEYYFSFGVVYAIANLALFF